MLFNTSSGLKVTLAKRLRLFLYWNLSGQKSNTESGEMQLLDLHFLQQADPLQWQPAGKAGNLQTGI